jgi:hypothetical protein
VTPVLPALQRTNLLVVDPHGRSTTSLAFGGRCPVSFGSGPSGAMTKSIDQLLVIYCRNPYAVTVSMTSLSTATTPTRLALLNP